MSTLIVKGIRLALVCTFATVCQSSTTLFAQSNAWQRYNAEGFSVLLPEQPTTTEIARPREMPDERKTARLFSAYEDRVAYVILAFDNPKQRDPLSRFIDEIGKYNVSGKAERFQQDLSGAGFTAKEYSFGSGSTLTGVVRFYLAADRVYIVEAIGDDIARASVKQFLDSFLIGGDGGAKSISNPPAAEGVTIFRAESESTTEPKVFSGKDVTPKARILVKPEPMYTEAGRQAGTVVLRGILASTGHVTNLRVVSGLPNGLTEQAIEAARNMRFIPAMKEGRHVSMYIQLEYNFNLY